jgi:hypothetical protein
MPLSPWHFFTLLSDKDTLSETSDWRMWCRTGEKICENVDINNQYLKPNSVRGSAKAHGTNFLNIPEKTDTSSTDKAGSFPYAVIFLDITGLEGCGHI